MLFFCSGGLALAYELAWVRLISLHMGSEALGFTLVLSVFMGGLALGAWAGGRWADRWPDPLTRYGYIELFIAVYAGLSPLLFPAVMTGVVEAAIGLGWTEHLATLTTLRFAVATALLLGPTVLMGVTLPMLTRYYALRQPSAGRGAGLLYGLNTLGAFVGTACAGFLLMPLLGTSRTLVVGAVANMLIALTAVALGRWTENRRPAPPAPQVIAPRHETPSTVEPAARRWLCVAVFLTGFAFMACEVAWARVLTLTLGASIYAVTLVLATVLAGLGIGAAATARFAGTPERWRLAFYGLALASAIAVAGSAFLLPYMPGLFLRLYWSWDLPADFALVVAAELLICAVVMLPAAVLMGGLFPAAARLYVLESRHAGESTGRLYAINTVGDILGAMAGGLLLVPLLGMREAMLVALSAQCLAAGCVYIRHRGRHRSGLLISGALALGVVLVLATPSWDRLVITSGMYQYAGSRKWALQDDLREMLGESRDLLYYRDSWIATVSVTRSRSDDMRSLYINGKADGSTGADLSTQRLIAHVPLAIHPGPQSVCVIGMGTGCTAGSASLYPVEDITVVEIEPAVVEAARFFSDVNYAVHDNPKVHIRVTDGRFFLRLNRDRFDIVLSEPSNPWQVGNSDLFTADFFRMGAAALRDGGMFCQWVQTYGLSPENFQTIVRTFSTVFPHVYLADLDAGNILMIGSMTPRSLDLQTASQRFEQFPGIAKDLDDPRVPVRGYLDTLSLIRLGPAKVRELSEEGPIHTDDHPIIAYLAPADLYRKTDLDNQAVLAYFADGIAPHIGTWPDPSPPGRRELLLRLAEIYFNRFGPLSSEAGNARQLAEKLTP